MFAIAAVDRNFGIGAKGQLLVTIPQDQRFFREQTLGKTVIAGRKTLETFPGKKPLPDRHNIILTGNRNLYVPGAQIAYSVEEAVRLAGENSPEEEIAVIGGASVYKAFLPYIDRVLLTRIDFAYAADAYFPDITKDPEWQLTWESDEMTCFDIIYTFTEYQRRKK